MKSQCIESHVSNLKSENSVLLDRITRQDAEINRLQIQLSAVTEERDSLKTKVSVMFGIFLHFVMIAVIIYVAIIEAKVCMSSHYFHANPKF